MGLKSKTVREEVITITPEFHGEKVEIKYYPSRYSVNQARQFERDLKTASDEDKVELMAKWVCDTINYVDWTDDNGAPVPLTVERLMDEPAAILMFLLQSVSDHINTAQKK